MGGEILGIDAVYFWLIVSALLGVVEIFTITFFALPLALGALLTSGLVWLFAPSVSVQIWFFIISSIIGLVIVQVWFRKWMQKDAEAHSIRSNTDALIGRTAVVVEEIKGKNGRGAVKVGGETWTAIAVDDSTLRPPQQVYVHAVDGVKLVVGPKPPNPDNQEV